MKTVAFIAERFDSDSRIANVVRRAVEELGARFARVDYATTQSSVAEAVYELLRSASVVVAHLSSASPNVAYEMGLAHGLKKPLVIVAPKGERYIPTDLLGQLYLAYQPGAGDYENLRFRISELLYKELRHPGGAHGLRGPSEKRREPEYDAPAPAGDVHGAFLRILQLGGRAQARALEEWFASLVVATPGWEVVTAEGGPRPETFDMVVWRSQDDSDLAPLGNPVGVELKAVKRARADSVLAASQRAQLQGLRSLLFVTTGQCGPAVWDTVWRMYEVQRFVVVVLDRDSLSSVDAPDDLVSRVGEQVRRVLYGSPYDV